MFGLNKGDIVDNEDPGLAYSAQIVCNGFGCTDSIAAPVEGPGAAKRTVPWTAAAEFNRGAGVEHADEIFSAMPHQVAGGSVVVEVLEHPDWRPLACGGDGTRHTSKSADVAGKRVEQRADDGLSFPLHDTIDRSVGMSEQSAGDK